jgi:hypothetical protein
MRKYEDNPSVRDGHREGRSIATLTLIVAAVFIACFMVGLSMPVLPPHVHEALASPPSFSFSP